MTTITSQTKTTAIFLALSAFVFAALTSGCIGAADSQGEGDFSEEATSPDGNEDVGESVAPIRGGVFQGCPAGTWQCGYGCTSTDYGCA